jgi:hypothetical protein
MFHGKLFVTQAKQSIGDMGFRVGACTQTKNGDKTCRQKGMAATASTKKHDLGDRRPHAADSMTE